MGDLSRKTVSIYIDNAPAQLALQNLQAQADKFTEAITKGQAAGKSMVAELSKLDKVKSQIAGVQAQIDSGLRPSINQLQSALSKANAEFKKMSQDDVGFKEKVTQVKALETQLGSLKGQIKTVQDSSEAFGGAFGKIFTRVTEYISAYAILKGLKNLLVSVFDAALEADTVTTRFKATLHNLGKDDAFDRIEKSAKALHDRFNTFGKIEIIDVFEQLAIFGKLSEQQMNDLLPVILNFSAQTGKSLKESTELFLGAIEGKAPALKQFGIILKDSKTEAERFALIMDVVAEKVNGAADAFGETTQGKLKATKERFEELEIELGSKLLPVVNSLLSSFNTFLDTLSHGKIVAPAIDFKNITDSKRKVDLLLQSSEAGGTQSIQDLINKAAENQINLTKEQVQKIIDPGFFRGAIKLPSELGLGQLDLNKPFDGGAGLSTKTAEQIAAAAKSAKDALDKLLKEWEDLQKKIFGDTSDPVLEKIRKINDEAADEAKQLSDIFSKKLISQEKFSDASIRIEQNRIEALHALFEKFKIDQAQVGAGGLGTPGGTGIPALIKSTGTIAGPDVADLDKQRKLAAENLFNDEMAKLDLIAITSSGKKKLDAEKTELDFQEAQELANTNLTESEKALIEERYRQAKAKLDKDALNDTTKNILDVAKGLSNFYSSINSAQDQIDQQHEADTQKKLDVDTQRLNRQLTEKVLSQKEYDRQLKALQDKKAKDDLEISIKEFKRNQEMQVINAIIAGAEAEVEAFKLPPPFNFIEAGIIGVSTLAQIYLIEKQKPPSLGQGGILDGPLHSRGGMPVINPATGKKVAEVEGGEPILSRKTYANNRELVDQLLHESMYGNGGSIIPYWKQRSYTPINYAGVSRTIERMKHYERGGIFDSSVINNNSNGFPIELLNSISKSLDNVGDAVNELRKDNNLPKKNYVLVTDVNAEQELYNRIQRETTMKRK